MKSRWVRYWSRHGKLAYLLVALGWTLAAWGQTQAEPSMSGREGIIAATITIILGSLVALFGIAAGITKWLIEPNVRKGVAEHEAKREAAHSGVYVSFETWDKKHSELVGRVDAIKDGVNSHITEEMRRVSGEMKSLRDELARGRGGRGGGGGAKHE